MTTAPQPETAHPPTHALTVLGAGVMGVGITALALGHGLPVHLVDIDRAGLARARDRVAGELRLAQLLGALPPAPPPGG